MTAAVLAPSLDTLAHSQTDYLAFAHDPYARLRWVQDVRDLGRRIRTVGPEQKAQAIRASGLFPRPHLRGNGTATVQSFSQGEDVTYIVDYGRRTCACPAGRHGTLCHHWWQVHLEAEERAGYTNAQHRREEVA